MLNFITEEHRLIEASAAKLFADIAAKDTELRQRGGQRASLDIVGRGLAQLGVFDEGDDNAAMSTAQVQVFVVREAGGASLAFPVLETLVAHAVAMRARRSLQTGGGGITTVSLTSEPDAQLPRCGGGSVTGRIRLVPFADAASTVLAVVNRDGDATLARIAVAAAGVRCAPRASVEADYPIFDMQLDSAATAGFSRNLDDGSDAAIFLRQRSALLAAAEISGACRRMVWMTRDYIKTRSQFGELLAANQVLKHALADAYVRVEAMIAAIDYAAAAADAGSDEAPAAIHAAKLFAGKAGRMIAEGMLQLHGAIGYTMEFPLQLSIRRVLRLGVSHGSTREQGVRLFRIFEQLERGQKSAKEIPA